MGWWLHSIDTDTCGEIGAGFCCLWNLDFNVVPDQVSRPCSKQISEGLDWILKQHTCTPFSLENAPRAMLSQSRRLMMCLPESIRDADADQ